MRRSHPRPGSLVRAVLVGTAACTVAACGSGTGGSGDRAQIEENWSTFFSFESPAGVKIALLQNGDRYSDVLRELARSSLAQQAHAQVTGVDVHGQSAEVTYTIDRGGTPVLKDRTGRAVRVDGVWQVSDETFCSLVTLAHPRPPQCPAASAGSSSSAGSASG